MNNKSWIWVEDIFERIPLPPIILFFVMTCFFFGSFIFFVEQGVLGLGLSFNQINLNETIILNEIVGGLNLYSCQALIKVISMSLVVPFQLIFINFLLKRVKFAFQNIRCDPESEEHLKNFYLKIGDKYRHSPLKYIFLFSITLPFFILLFWQAHHNPGLKFLLDLKLLLLCSEWEQIFMIYNKGISFLIFYFISVNIWIFYIIYWSLKEISTYPYKEFINLALIDANNLGGFAPLWKLILSGIMYYSLCVTLSISTYFNLQKLTIYGLPFSIEGFYLTVLFFVGIIILVLGLKSIKDLLKSKIKEELDRLNDVYEIQYHKLKIIVSEENYKNDVCLSQISNILNAIYTEKERIVNINSKGYDLYTILALIFSLLIQIISKILELKIVQSFN